MPSSTSRRCRRFAGSDARPAARPPAASGRAALRASGLGRRRLFEKRLPVRNQLAVAIAVQRLDELRVLLLLRLAEEAVSASRSSTGRSAGCRLSARTSTSMSRGGPVRRPSHENSVEKCSTASAGTRA